MLARTSSHTLRLRSFLLVASLILFAALLPLSLATMRPQTTPNATVAPSQALDFGKLPLSFEANRGQTDPSVRYMAHASGGTMYFTPSEVVLTLQSSSEVSPSGARGSVGLASLSAASIPDAADAQPTTSIVRLQFIGSTPDTEMSSGEALPGKVNYFIGNDPSKWQVNVPTYSGVTYASLYTGVDLQYAGDGSQLKGTYTVAAGADPSKIRWQYSGADKVTVHGTGNLQITVSKIANTAKDDQPVMVTEEAPVAWQEIEGARIPVSAQYLVAPDQSIGFALGSYDHNYPLIIDPTLTYSTYLGGSRFDAGQSIAVDTSGNAYVTGYTDSTDFPLQDPFQPIYGGGAQDVFVTKFSATGSALIYSTYLGGSNREFGYGIAVDTSGNAYVTGFTDSTNFPLLDPFQPNFGGGDILGDAFVTKFSATGSALIYSTYLGGSDDDFGSGIAVDTSGNAYVAGGTESTDFPLQDPFQPIYGGGLEDVFVTKFSATGSALIYSTYLGGSNFDRGQGIAVDTSGNVYVTGATSSGNFPLQNPFQPTYRGGDTEVFVTKFSATGSALIYSTYLGGSDGDYSRGIAVDTSGNAYVTGQTYSTNFPLQNPFQPTPGGGGQSDVFVTKFSATGSNLIYSTYLGGSSIDRGQGIAVDTSGNAYVTGRTDSTNFPLQDPFQPSFGGTQDAFVTKLNATGTNLLYSTYLGGSLRDEGYGIAVDTSGNDYNAYVTGFTYSTNFPLQDPFQPALGGGHDVFVTKLTDQSISQPTATFVQPTNTPVPPTGCTLTFTDVPEGSTFYANIRCLACRGIISGYADGTFRPNNEVTRGQLAKIVSNAAGFSESPDPQIFEDVPSSNTFYQWVNRLARRGHMSGYVCGGVGEPCTTGMPYFRPFANATRGQTSKIVSNAAGYAEIPTDQTFEDVPPSHTFYREIQRLATRNIMQGYPCGGAGEPCISGRPYFRPANNVTRGQSAKIVANTFYPGCVTP